MFDMITGLIASAGLAGIALLMFVENVFPPVPSELIMPLAGYNAAMGRMSFVAVVLAGSAGSLAGAWFWYWLARRVPEEKIRRFIRRHGRWAGIDLVGLRMARRWFRRYGASAVLIGRLIPAARTLISIPAGLVRMPPLKFLIFSAIGTLLWTTFLTSLGYILEAQYDRIAAWLDPVSTGIVVLCVLAYVWRVVTYDQPGGSRDAPNR
ncbi:DedA family protein [Paenirhodobacter populi]|uniref:DedA family protein n=1 Tax=Paenirhodobacter populi TaxID=2306993 RepID=A0A443J8C9_9RHOB|nr:DedA family protein [Sinirhodobacter populi]RWR16757.1 DedA family protein [Sinirhodobacter populi]